MAKDQRRAGNMEGFNCTQPNESAFNFLQTMKQRITTAAWLPSSSIHKELHSRIRGGC